MIDNKYFDEWENKIQLSNLINYIKRKTNEYEYNINLNEEYIILQRKLNKLNIKEK